MKKKLIILGGGGFISSHVEKICRQKNKKYVAFKRKKIDLTKMSNVKKVKKSINPKDVIFFVAAKAPAKDLFMFNQNVKMVKNFCKVFNENNFSKIIYLSSDAVYSDSKKKLKETSLKKPKSFHGLMHLTREKIIKKNFSIKKILILRPTLVYGKKDPHNGYGPNKFLKEAKTKRKIHIFGKGEELRDQIWVKDLANIIFRMIFSNQHGEFNCTTGKLISFYSIAKTIKKIKKIKIIHIKRKGKMPHNGYRPISNLKIRKLFPNYKFKTFSEIINKL